MSSVGGSVTWVRWTSFVLTPYKSNVFVIRILFSFGFSKEPNLLSFVDPTDLSVTEEYPNKKFLSSTLQLWGFNIKWYHTGVLIRRIHEVMEYLWTPRNTPSLYKLFLNCFSLEDYLVGSSKSIIIVKDPRFCYVNS